MTGQPVWWVNPWKFGLFFLIPGYVFLYLTPLVLGTAVITLRARIYLDLPLFLLGLAFLVVLIAWAALFTALDVGRIGTVAGTRTTVNPLFLDFLALAAIGAYGIWFQNLILNPAALLPFLQAESAASYSVRLENEKIPGITSATQFAVAYVVFYLNQRIINGIAWPSRRYAVYFWLLIGLTLLRVYGWAERLALIEILIPALVIWAIHARVAKERVARILLTGGPFIGIGLLIMYFGATEFYRSWLADYQFRGEPFWSWVVNRVVTYYYTALNNGALMLTVLSWPNWKFEHTLAWLHSFPFLVGPIFRHMIEFGRRHGTSSIHTAIPSSTTSRASSWSSMTSAFR